MKIMNMPAYADEYRYIVARECDGDLWFYGAYETEDRAYGVARQVRGVVVERG